MLAPERLAEIRERAEAHSASNAYANDVRDLLAEVDRLTERERLLGQSAADLMEQCERRAQEIAELRAALEPFALFAEKWEARPIGGLHDTLYSIHHGEIGAEFRLSDCKRARAALAREVK